MESQYNIWETKLPQDRYVSALEIIHGINFTRREVDIISCVLSGKTCKKIAAFLAISPKTVENHIRNLMLKTGCNSQMGVTEFIEKSSQFPLVKNHYSSLLIQHNFATELKNISKMLPQKISCYLVYNKNSKKLIPFFNYFIQDLKLAGINITIKYTQKNNLDFDLLHNMPNIKTCPVLYGVTPEQIENSDLDKIIRFIDQYSCRFTLINIATSHNLPSSNIIFPLKIMTLAALQNYYFFFFEVLTKLLAPINLQSNIKNFTEKYKIFNKCPLLQSETNGAFFTNF